MELECKTVINDVLGINNFISELGEGDMVQICYRRPKLSSHTTLGDFYYVVGFVVKIDPTQVTLSNVSPEYSHFSLPPFVETRHTYKVNRICELEKIIKKY